MSLTRVFIFLAVICGLTFGIHYYLWVRLVRDPVLITPWRQIATAAIVVLGLSIPTSMLIWRVVPREIANSIAWFGYVWMGVMFLVLMLLWTGEFVRWGWLRFAVEELPSEERRVFLARVLAGGAALLGGLLSGWAVWEAVKPVEVKRVAVKLRKLGESMRGFRIVQLTDVHVGPTIGVEFVDHIVEEVNKLDADVVVITGDLMDGSVAELGHAIGKLGKLKSKHGTFFVTGNHEYYSGADPWLAFLSRIGIRPLRNEHVEIKNGSSALQLAGVDDWTAFGDGHGADLERALLGRDESKPVILLAHQPKQFPEAVQRQVDLQLSGHTHGGQIYPFGYLTRLVQPFIAGLHRRGDSQIYVSSGTGYWGPPMRLLAPSEITLIELDSELASA